MKNKKKRTPVPPRHPDVHQQRRRLVARPALRDHQLPVAPHRRVRDTRPAPAAKRPPQPRARGHERSHDFHGLDVHLVEDGARALEPRGEQARASVVDLLARHDGGADRCLHLPGFLILLIALKLFGDGAVAAHPPPGDPVHLGAVLGPARRVSEPRVVVTAFDLFLVYTGDDTFIDG